MLQVPSSLRLAYFLLLAFVMNTSVAVTATKIPAFIKQNRVKYTPLLFFKVPVGQMPECELYELLYVLDLIMVS
jgi:hypothetical protein